MTIHPSQIKLGCGTLLMEHWGRPLFVLRDLRADSTRGVGFAVEEVEAYSVCVAQTAEATREGVVYLNREQARDTNGFYSCNAFSSLDDAQRARVYQETEQAARRSRLRQRQMARTP
ncbi:MAG: hypothetical protein AAFP26_11085 [Planctomycetota bacterium]